MNTSSILSSINSSLHSSLQSLSLLQVTAMSIQNYFSYVYNFSQRVDQRSQASLTTLRQAVNSSEYARNSSSEYLRRAQEAFSSLQPVDNSKLAAIRQLLADTRVAAMETDVAEMYRSLQQRLSEQRSQRQMLEVQLWSMRADVERLRRLNATLPTTLPDRCN